MVGWELRKNLKGSGTLKPNKKNVSLVLRISVVSPFLK